MPHGGEGGEGGGGGTESASVPCLNDPFVFRDVLSVHLSSNHILGPNKWNNCYLRCFQADALVLTLLSDDWRVAGFDAGVLVCSLIMPQIISMEQRETTDYVFLYGGCFFISVTPRAGLSASCRAPFPCL